ncbi:MAG TPA: hypothetical protein DCX03_11920, partial [Bacteroidales bacterium]|nr:hypothetical protein [Bacteroidales bacterium]
RVKEEATSEIRQLLNKEREQQARRLERVRQTEMLNSFKQSKNIPDSEFQEFIKWASTNQITLDSLYDVYATKKRMSSAEKEAVKSVKNQIQRNSYLPDTVAGIPSAPQRKQTDEDEFMRNLRASIGHADY